MKMLWGSASLLLLGGCFRGVFKDAPEPDPPPPDAAHVELRVSSWSPRLRGRLDLRSEAEGEELPRTREVPLYLGRETGLRDSDGGVRELDARMMGLSPEGYWEGFRFRYRRGTWRSDRVLDENEELGAATLPAGALLSSRAEHFFYGIGWCRRMSVSEDLVALATSGMAATAVTFRFEGPEVTERPGIGGGLFWFDGELEYRPSVFSFAANLGFVGLPAGGGLETGARAGLRWGGFCADLGYRYQSILPESANGRVTLTGVVWSVGFEF